MLQAKNEQLQDTVVAQSREILELKLSQGSDQRLKDQLEFTQQQLKASLPKRYQPLI